MLPNAFWSRDVGQRNAGRSPSTAPAGRPAGRLRSDCQRLTAGPCVIVTSLLARYIAAAQPQQRRQRGVSWVNDHHPVLM